MKLIKVHKKQNRRVFVSGLIFVLVYCFCILEEPVRAESYNHRWVLLTNMGGQAMRKKDYKKAKLCFEKALRESKNYGNRSKEMASSINNLAGVSMEQGHWKDAESYLVLALSMREDILSPRDPRIANTCYNLGICAFKQNKLNEAERYFSRAIDVRYSYKKDQVRISEEMGWLARVYKKQGRLDQARELLKQAISMRKKGHGRKNPVTLNLEKELESLGPGN